DVLPAFCRSENDLLFGTEPYHGASGPIPITRAPLSRMGAVDQALCEAALGHGHPWEPDHNKPGSTGVSPYAINSRDGVRVSTNDGYLEGARGRNNLTILGDAHVDRILFDGLRAVGVRLRTREGWREIRGGEI